VLTLALDASTYAGSVALLEQDSVVGESTAGMRGEREERLMPAVAALLAAHRARAADLSAVACGGGPGSFTSLRIAASIAKGLAAAGRTSLWTAPSPLLVVAGAVPRLTPGRYLAALDAMRGDVFSLLVTIGDDGALQVDGRVMLLPRADAELRAAALGATIVGPLADRGLAPLARGFGPLFRQGLARRVEVAIWEPDYGRKAEAQVQWEKAHGRALESP
jgi:tRNA threonylcarbamoyladenosine biosynthesis protein TsaB